MNDSEKTVALKVTIATDGTVIGVENPDGTPVSLASDQETLINSARLTSHDPTTNTDCCWRYVNGKWICDPAYC